MTQLALPDTFITLPTTSEAPLPSEIQDQLAALAHDLQCYAEKMGFPTPILPE